MLAWKSLRIQTKIYRLLLFSFILLLLKGSYQLAKMAFSITHLILWYLHIMTYSLNFVLDPCNNNNNNIMLYYISIISVFRSFGSFLGRFLLIGNRSWSESWHFIMFISSYFPHIIFFNSLINSKIT